MLFCILKSKFMEYYKLWTAVFGVGLIVMFMVAAKPDKKPSASQENIDEESFAVVELFTSEGCSSCALADELLGDLVQKTRKKDQRIFAPAFHVDYWNRLGWKDEYSRAEYSQRQRSYANDLEQCLYPANDHQ